MLLRSQGRHVQHMHEALTQMNIPLTNVLYDVVGESGRKTLRTIVEEIAKSFQGHWRAEHLFALKQALGAFDFVST